MARDLPIIREDINLAFEHWRHFAESTDGAVRRKKARAVALESQARVNAFLAQLDAERKQLHAALAACHAIVDVNANGGIITNPATDKAARLARIALGGIKDSEHHEED